MTDLRGGELAVLAVWLTALFGSGVSPVHAQQSSDGEEVSEERIREFEAMMARGVEQFKAEQYEKALRQFRAAAEIASPPTLRYNIARTLQALGRCEKARETFETFLDREGLTAKQRENGRRRLRELEEGCDDSEEAPESSDRTTASESPSSRESIDEVEPEDEGTERVEAIETEEAEPPQPTPLSRYLQWTGIGLGGGLLVGAFVSDWTARRRLEQLSEADRAGDYEAIREIERRGERARNRTAILFAAGGLTTLGSTLWLILEKSGESGRRADRRFTIDLSFGGITGGVRW